MSDWTAEAEEAIGLCELWAKKVVADIPCNLFLFGSAIYKGGEQFDRVNSDLDIVCLLPEPNTAFTRLSALQQLHKHKAALELQMIPALSRLNCSEPGVSIVTITELELKGNVHKSGARSFFNKNFFYDLAEKTEYIGIPGAASLIVRDENRQALEYVQKIRNEYLAVCANGTGGLGAFRGADPMPKSLLRAAVQLNPDAIEGEWYDTRLGLELMHSILRERRTESHESKRLFDRISVRRGGRGTKENLSAEDQLLLAELLFDVAKTRSAEKVATWEIKLSGESVSLSEAGALFAGLSRLIPDAQLIGIRSGSVILRIRSSVKGYDLVSELLELEVLARLLKVEGVEVIQIGQDASGFEEFGGGSREQHVIEYISSWKPRRMEPRIFEEQEFAEYLAKATEADPVLEGMQMIRNVQMTDVEIPFQMDFLLSWPENKGYERLGVDLSRVHSKSTFFYKISQLLPVGRPVILVAVGLQKLLEDLQPDIDRLAQINSNIKVVPIVWPD